MSMIEIVVSLALLGIGVAACVACIGSATRASARAEEYTAVELLAREKLSELQQGSSEADGAGDFGPDRPGYWWQSATQPPDSEGLRHLRLTLYWGEPDRPRSTHFETLLSPRALNHPDGNVACAGCHPKGAPRRKAAGK